MTKENWTIEIKPKKKWLDIDLKGIWRTVTYTICT